MKLSNLNEWLSLVANFGVIAGIVFLGIEIRQNTLMMEAQTRTEVSQSVLQILEVQRNPGVIEALRKRALGEDSEFEDRFHLQNLARTMLRTWENTSYQYQNGLLNEEEFQADYRAWAGIMNADYMQNEWEISRENFSPEFRNVMDQLSK